jgi:diguanylate cyclase (GGDEF)-like protein
MTAAEIRATLDANNRWLRFPEPLETLYLAKHIPRAIKHLHVLTPLMIVLYLLLISGIVAALPDSDFRFWLTIDIWVSVAVIAVLILSFFPAFNDWYQWYAACAGAVIIALSISICNIIPLGSSAPLSYAGIIFAVLIVYTSIGITFFWGLAAGVFGGIVGVLLTYFLNSTVDWALLSRTYGCASILGIGLSYALENQERKNFLHMSLLHLTVQKGEDLAKQLEALSRQDAMTGLANRRHLDEVLDSEVKRALRQNDPLTVMIIDVDYFKVYNDTHGHLAGDECLRQIAQLLLIMTQRGGELAARYGGEEFVLVYPAMDTPLAQQQAIRLLEGMETLALPHPNGDAVTFSIGVAVYAPIKGSTSCIDVEQLLRNADTALYSAKKNGRNRYVFNPDTRSRATS